VEYDANILLALEEFIPRVRSANNTEEDICIKLFRSGPNVSYHLLSNFFQLNGERFTGIHKIRRFTEKGDPVIAPGTGINLGEQETKTLFRWFPAFKQMLQDAQKLGARGLDG
jgi:hypothetical protein